MAKILIIDTPPGEAPIEIRQAWVGIEIPLIGYTDPHACQKGAQGGPPTPENLNGYEVHGADAIRALRQAGRDKAANWWIEESSLGGGHLVFARSACTLIPDGDHAFSGEEEASSAPDDDIPF